MVARTAAECAASACEDLPYVPGRCYPPGKSSIGSWIPPPQEKLFAEDSGRCFGPPYPDLYVFDGGSSSVRFRETVPDGGVSWCSGCGIAGWSAG